jgi:hypothetical protein
MRAAVVDRHRFIGVGGLGYLNVRAAKGRPNIVPNEPAFSLMNAAFLLMDSGTMRPTDCLREMAKRGLRSKHGNEITVGKTRFIAGRSLLRNGVFSLASIRLA